MCIRAPYKHLELWKKDLCHHAQSSRAMRDTSKCKIRTLIPSYNNKIFHIDQNFFLALKDKIWPDTNKNTTWISDSSTLPIFAFLFFRVCGSESFLIIVLQLILQTEIFIPVFNDAENCPCEEILLELHQNSCYSQHVQCTVCWAAW